MGPNIGRWRTPVNAEWNTLTFRLKKGGETRENLLLYYQTLSEFILTHLP